jgi:hypothetical protein
MADRTFFVRLNLDDLADQMDALDSSEERGQWLEGFRVGSRGHASRDTWNDAKLRGHSFGMTCWEQAEAFRVAQSVKGRASADARRKKGGNEPEVNRGSTTVPTAVRTEHPTGSQPIQNPESNNQETKSEQPSPPIPPKGGRRRMGAFVPPTEQEWVDYCTKTWPDWHQTCAAESWAYYESVKWRMRSGPIQPRPRTGTPANGASSSQVLRPALLLPALLLRDTGPMQPGSNATRES